MNRFFDKRRRCRPGWRSKLIFDPAGQYFRFQTGAAKKSCSILGRTAEHPRGLWRHDIVGEFSKQGPRNGMFSSMSTQLAAQGRREDWVMARRDCRCPGAHDRDHCSSLSRGGQGCGSVLRRNSISRTREFVADEMFQSALRREAQGRLVRSRHAAADVTARIQYGDQHRFCPRTVKALAAAVNRIPLGQLS